MVRLSKQVKITKFISKGFEQILCSKGAGQVCEQIAREIQEKANAGLTSEDSSGFSMGGKIDKAYGSNRWIYFVHTTDAATMFAEKYDQTLTKAVK